MTLEKAQEMETILDLLLSHFEEVKTKAICIGPEEDNWGVLVFISLFGIELDATKIVINKEEDLEKIIPFLNDNGYIKVN